MKRFLPLVLGALLLVACSGPGATGPTLENGLNDKSFEFEATPDVDYRAEGPFSEGPDAPPNVKF